MTNRRIGPECPICRARTVAKATGRNTYIWQCERYRRCTYTRRCHPDDEAEFAKEDAARRPPPLPPPPPVERVRVGVFVRDPVWGYGKVIVVGGGSAVVEFFSSPAARDRRRISFPIEQINPVHPSPGTRCFIEDQGAWWIGRVVAPLVADQADIKYEVRQEGQRPGVRPKTVLATELYVRCRAELPDPVDVIKYGALHPPQSSLHRSEFIRNLLQQRRLSHGFTSLTSSNIELHRHQVEIAQRVLSDPIQRYLLADEVGLGKTIEAGIIIRQYLIDEPRLNVLVCVPKLLVSQWQRELIEKFRLTDWPNRWTVIPHESLDPEVLPSSVGLLVVDEVHNLFREAESPKAIEVRSAVQRAAQMVPRVLLLSATPLLHNESVFLGMLNLLDPSLYPLHELEEFRERVESKQVLAEQLQSFTEDASLWLLEDLAEAFKESFANDEVLHERLNELLNACRKSDPDEVQIRSLIRPIRIHLSETYRLHRRVLRTRRHSPLASEFPVRGRRLARPIEASASLDVDHATSVVDDWCGRWMATFSRRAQNESIAPDELVVVSGLLDRLQTLPSIAWNYCEVWLGRPDRTSADAAELNDRERRALAVVRPSQDEEALLHELIEHLRDAGTDVAWQRRCVSEIRQLPHGSLVFCGFDQAATRLGSELASAGVGARTLTDGEGADAALFWLREQAGQVLLCGRNAEEGYNAQFAESMLLLHLPLNPGRLEQRIGRIDRFGSGGPVNIHLPLRLNRWSVQWATYLDQAMGIFDESIASLQHVIEAEVARILARFMTHGMNEGSWLELARQQRTELELEKDRILRLEALESIEAESDERGTLFNDLLTAQAEVDVFHESVLDWLGRAGRVHSIGLSVSGEGTVGYPPVAVTMGVHRSIVREELALGEQDEWFLVNESATPGPGSRVVAARVGSPFIRRLELLTAADDLGQTYGFVRDAGVPEPTLLAQVTLRIDGATRRIRETLQRDLQHLGRDIAWESVARLVDGLIPPQHLVVHFDTDGNRANTELEVLAAPRFGAGEDAELGAEQLARIIRGYGIDWVTWWSGSREAALEEARSSVDLEQVRRDAHSRLDDSLLKLTQQINLREHHETDVKIIESLKRDLQQQLAIGEIVRAAIDLVEPVIETVGAVLLRAPMGRGR